MRSRTIREGSVGLLILLGLSVFVGLVVWIRGLNLSNRTYKFIVSFPNVAGMTQGATVRYRGVAVGKIAEVQAETNGVNATIEISSADLLIPRDATIEANQSGLIGETSIDITPLTSLPTNALSINPLSSDCNSDLVICNKARLRGQIGVSFDELLRNTIRFSAAYSDPVFFNNINTLTKNASVASAGVARLTSELSLLSRSVRREVGGFSTAANSVTTAANQTTNQLGFAASRIANTADQYSLTAGQLNQLAASANDLVVSNRGTLVRTLNSVSQTSDQLRLLLGSLSPTLEQVNSTVGRLNTTAGQVNVTTLLGNLETLSTNAATASTNLRDISTALNSPANVLVLQQTLDSARATFENAQKITADLDEITGDPAFRNNLKQLVNGLGNLVSSTEQLQQQVHMAQTIEPVSAAINTAASSNIARPLTNQQSQPNGQPVAFPMQADTQKQLLKLSPPAPKKPSAGATSVPAAEEVGEKQNP